MTFLNENTQNAIQKWGQLNSDNLAVAKVLINYAAESPYLATQLNTFFEKKGTLRVGTAGGGSSTLGLFITIDANAVSRFLGTSIGEKRLATLLAHELAHAISTGGSGFSDVIKNPFEAEKSGQQAEGVALASEMIVCSGLINPDTNLGENARHGEVFDDKTKTNVFTGVQAAGR